MIFQPPTERVAHRTSALSRPLRNGDGPACFAERNGQPVRETVRRENGNSVKYLISLVGPAGLEPATRPL